MLNKFGPARTQNSVLDQEVHVIGKAAGPDNLTAEYLKHAHKNLSVLLSLCFSSCLSHGFLPNSIMDSVVLPIVKNKCGNLSDSNNYRPVAISNVCSKIFEHVILYLCEDYLWTADNQFGFKTGLGTDMCIYALREFVEHYEARSTIICYIS